MWRAHGTENLITTSLEAPPIQRSDLIDEIENSIKAKNKMAAMLTCLHVAHTWTSTWNQVHVYMHSGTGVHISAAESESKINSLGNLKGKRQMAAMVKLSITRYAHSAPITCNPKPRFRCESTRETLYVIASRDNVRVHLESLRTWSPRESSYMTSSRIIERDYLENRCTCLPRDQLRGQAVVREKVIPEAEKPQKGQR